MKVLTRCAVPLCVWLCAIAAWGQTGVPSEDRVDVLRLDRRLVALDAAGASLAELDLELGEEVLALESQGVLGIASTSARLLGFRSGDAGWHELRYRRSEREQPPGRLHLAERIALVALPARVVALTPSSRGWLELDLGPGERAERVLADTNLAAVVTSRRAIGVSAPGGFAEIGLSPRESVETTSQQDSSISLLTQRRLLVYRAGSSLWLDLPRQIDP